MGRKRRRTVTKDDVAEDIDIEEESPLKKKTKKEKHKKKKSKRESLEREVDVQPVKPLTLKIRFGNEVVTTETTSDISSVIEDDDISSMHTADISSNSIKSGLKQNSEDWGGSDDVVSVGDDSFQATTPDPLLEREEGVVVDELEVELEEGEELEGDNAEEDEDEEVWLEALETGNVDERGYLPQKKDPMAMTARQRAILGSKEVELLELPLVKKRPVAEDEETQEMLLKKTERNKKRRLQAIKRREKHKAETVQKLLQKQSRKKEDKKVDKSVVGPHLRYINNANGITISLTEGLDYPLSAKPHPLTHAPPPHPPVITCSMCTAPKRYSDSVTKLPLCSLECYNKLKHTNNNTLSLPC